jgi:hypothetical protein
LAKLGVWLGPGAVFRVLCVICGVFARLAEKRAVFPGFRGGRGRKARVLQCFAALLGGGPRGGGRMVQKKTHFGCSKRGNIFTMLDQCSGLAITR